jgi:hypothetical protein
MLGTIDSVPVGEVLTVHAGRRPGSVLSNTRWPLRQGQSNPIHLMRPPDTTITAPFLGNRSGISSADSTRPTMRARRNGSHSHQESFMRRARSVRGKAPPRPRRVCRVAGCNNGVRAARPRLSRFHVRAAGAEFRSGAVLARNQSSARAFR